jgi:hypothetical protein
MSKYNAIEGFSDCYGVNTHSSVPTGAEKAFYMSRAVNRSTYSGYNGTRPPFVEIPTKFQSTEEEFTFRNAAITGMKFYEGEAGLFSAFLIVSVGDRIMAGFIRANFIEFFTIYKGIDPQWIYGFFGQALNILTYNNGVDLPLYWNGVISQPMKKVIESAYVKTNPMMVSNLSVFAHGRFHVATKENLVYSGDFITSQGLDLEAREAVLSFKESTYPSSGDGFGAPAEMGQISGMIVMPKSDQINGHGDLMVACRNGFFSISPGNKIRNEWTNDPSMQSVVFTGKGCVAFDSLHSWGSQIYYRDSNNEISSLNYDISAYQRQINFDSISTYVEKYLAYDNNSSDVQITHGFSTAKRLFMTTGHMREVSSHMGTHRYANGLISACLQKRPQGSSLSWEGLWTGPRPVAAVTSNVGNYKRTIVASYDTDKQNRLYFIDETAKTNDYVRGEYRPIESKFSYSGIMFDEAPNRPLVNKKLERVETLLINSNPVSYSGSYSSNNTEELYPIKFQSTEVSGCGLTTILKQSEDIVASKSQTKNTPSSQGYFFTLNFKAEGIAEIAKVVFAGNVADQDGFNTTRCFRQDSPELSLCLSEEDVKDCNNDFTYQF